MQSISCAFALLGCLRLLGDFALLGHSVLGCPMSFSPRYQEHTLQPASSKLGSLAERRKAAVSLGSSRKAAGLVCFKNRYVPPIIMEM